MNSSNTTNQSGNRAFNPCNITYEDIVNRTINCQKSSHMLLLCDREVTTQEGKTYRQSEGLSHYYMTEMSTGNITPCPYGWWQNWFTTNNK